MLMRELLRPGAKTEAGGRAIEPTEAAVPGAAANGLSTHILPVSATMMGVCMTVLSIGHIGPAMATRWMMDKLLAMDALVFLASAVLSFVSMRAGFRRATMELRAEWFFIVGLGLLAMAALILAFAIN